MFTNCLIGNIYNKNREQEFKNDNCTNDKGKREKKENRNYRLICLLEGISFGKTTNINLVKFWKCFSYLFAIQKKIKFYSL